MICAVVVFCEAKIHEWRDIAHERVFARLSRPRVLGADQPFSGFGFEYEITSPDDPLWRLRSVSIGFFGVFVCVQFICCEQKGGGYTSLFCSAGDVLYKDLIIVKASTKDSCGEM